MSSAKGELCCLQDLQYQNHISVLQHCPSQQHTSQCQRGSPPRTLCMPYAFWGETSSPFVDRAPSEQIHSPFSPNPASRDVGSTQYSLKYRRNDMFAMHVERSSTCGRDLRVQYYVRFKLRNFLAPRIIRINITHA